VARSVMTLLARIGRGHGRATLQKHLFLYREQ
jgi:hypothetical protein